MSSAQGGRGKCGFMSMYYTVTDSTCLSILGRVVERITTWSCGIETRLFHIVDHDSLRDASKC